MAMLDPNCYSNLEFGYVDENYNYSTGSQGWQVPGPAIDPYEFADDRGSGIAVTGKRPEFYSHMLANQAGAEKSQSSDSFRSRVDTLASWGSDHNADERFKYANAARKVYRNFGIKYKDKVVESEPTDSIHDDIVFRRLPHKEAEFSRTGLGRDTKQFHNPEYIQSGFITHEGEFHHWDKARQTLEQHGIGKEHSGYALHDFRHGIKYNKSMRFDQPGEPLAKDCDCEEENCKHTVKSLRRRLRRLKEAGLVFHATAERHVPGIAQEGMHSGWFSEEPEHLMYPEGGPRNDKRIFLMTSRKDFKTSGKKRNAKQINLGDRKWIAPTNSEGFAGTWQESVKPKYVADKNLKNIQRLGKSMKRKGKGTGTKRRESLDTRTKDWGECSDHECQIHGKWSHPIAPNTECHFPRHGECEKCMTYPLMDKSRSRKIRHQILGGTKHLWEQARRKPENLKLVRTEDQFSGITKRAHPAPRGGGRYWTLEKEPAFGTPGEHTHEMPIGRALKTGKLYISNVTNADRKMRELKGTKNPYFRAVDASTWQQKRVPAEVHPNPTLQKFGPKSTRKLAGGVGSERLWVRVKEAHQIHPKPDFRTEFYHIPYEAKHRSRPIMQSEDEQLGSTPHELQRKKSWADDHPSTGDKPDMAKQEIARQVRDPVMAEIDSGKRCGFCSEEFKHNEAYDMFRGEYKVHKQCPAPPKVKKSGIYIIKSRNVNLVCSDCFNSKSIPHRELYKKYKLPNGEYRCRGCWDKVRSEAWMKKSLFRAPAQRLGDKIFEGKPGELHADIVERHNLWGQGSESGFVNKKGKFYDKPEANKRLKIHRRLAGKKDLLYGAHSITPEVVNLPEDAKKDPRWKQIREATVDDLVKEPSHKIYRSLYLLKGIFGSGLTKIPRVHGMKLLTPKDKNQELHLTEGQGLMGPIDYSANRVATTSNFAGHKFEAGDHTIIGPPKRERKTFRSSKTVMPYAVGHEIGHYLRGHNEEGFKDTSRRDTISKERQAWATGLKWLKNQGFKPDAPVYEAIKEHALGTYGRKHFGSEKAATGKLGERRKFGTIFLRSLVKGIFGSGMTKIPRVKDKQIKVHASDTRNNQFARETMQGTHRAHEAKVNSHSYGLAKFTDSEKHHLFPPTQQTRKRDKSFIPYAAAHEVGHALRGHLDETDIGGKKPTPKHRLRGHLGAIQKEREAWASGLMWLRKQGFKPKLSEYNRVQQYGLATYGDAPKEAEGKLGERRRFGTTFLKQKYMPRRVSIERK